MSLKEIVNDEVAEVLANNYDKLMRSKISRIHPDIYLSKFFFSLFEIFIQ